MNSPQLSVSTSLEVTAGVHGQDVVANQDVTLLPRVIIHDTAVVKKAIKNLANIGRSLGRQSINCDVSSLKVGLAGGPRLVISETRLASYRVVLDKRKPVEFGAVKRSCCDRPC